MTEVKEMQIAPITPILDMLATYTGARIVKTYNIGGENEAGDDCSLVVYIVSSEEGALYAISFIQRAKSGELICDAFIDHNQLMRETVWGFHDLAPAAFGAIFNESAIIKVNPGNQCSIVSITNNGRKYKLVAPTVKPPKEMRVPKSA